MQFKIKNTTFKISFTFFALILLLLKAEDLKMYLLIYTFALLHEFVHLFFIFKLSVPPKIFSLTLLGGTIIRQDNTHVSFEKEIIINISAPMCNLLFCVFFLFLKKCLGLNYSFIDEIIYINLILGCFNMLPYYNFDGGNALRNLLLLKISRRTTENILTVTSVIVTFIFSLTSVYVFFSYSQNISLIIISIYLLMMIVFKK